MRYIKSALVLITCMSVLFSQSILAGESDQVQELIEQTVVSYAAFGEKNEQQLSDLAALDPALGDKWNRIMDLWDTPVTVCEELPDGLPEDDTLSPMFQAGALIELSGDVETAFEIYYDTYDIHELPQLHEA